MRVSVTNLVTGDVRTVRVGEASHLILAHWRYATYEECLRRSQQIKDLHNDD